MTRRLTRGSLLYDHMSAQLNEYGPAGHARFWLIHCQDAFSVIHHMVAADLDGVQPMPFDTIYDRTVSGELQYHVHGIPLIVSPHARLGSPLLLEEAT